MVYRKFTPKEYKQTAPGSFVSSLFILPSSHCENFLFQQFQYKYQCHRCDSTVQTLSQCIYYQPLNPGAHTKSYTLKSNFTQNFGWLSSRCNRTSISRPASNGVPSLFHLQCVKASSDSETPPSWVGESDFALTSAVASYVLALLTPVLSAAYDISNPASPAHGALDFSTLFALLSTPNYSTHYTMIGILSFFALVHSGLASLRPYITPKTGERAYRIGFALSSLPLALLSILFWVEHRYDGAQLFRLQQYGATVPFVVILTIISFIFLYPATFNLLEVAAIKKPTFVIYETGITRISRHPQLWGQVMWCLAHTCWMGTSFTVVASLCLIGHHFLGAWNGDRRLRNKYQEIWEEYAERTSLVPFQALLDGRQKLVLSEFVRPAYLGIAIAITAFWYAHPIMIRVASNLPF